MRDYDSDLPNLLYYTSLSKIILSMHSLYLYLFAAYVDVFKWSSGIFLLLSQWSTLGHLAHTHFRDHWFVEYKRYDFPRIFHICLKHHTDGYEQSEQQIVVSFVNSG